MSDFTIYRNGNCTNTTTAEAEDQIYISVDFDYLRDSKSDYCQETIMCGENYISLRRVFKLNFNCWRSLISRVRSNSSFFISTYERWSTDCAKNMRRIYKWALSEVNFSILIHWRPIVSHELVLDSRSISDTEQQFYNRTCSCNDLECLG